jgi:hypothetical protein
VRDNSLAWRACVRVLASLPVLLRGRMWLPGRIVWVLKKIGDIAENAKSVYTTNLGAPVVACKPFHRRTHTLTRADLSEPETAWNACQRGVKCFSFSVHNLWITLIWGKSPSLQGDTDIKLEKKTTSLFLGRHCPTGFSGKSPSNNISSPVNNNLGAMFIYLSVMCWESSWESVWESVWESTRQLLQDTHLALSQA